MQRAAAARAGAAGGVDQHHVARQMSGQGAVVASRRPRRAAALPGLHRLLPGLVLGNALLKILEPELHLVRAELFRPTAELVPQQALDRQPELAALGMQCAMLIRCGGDHLPEHLLQVGRIIGQCVEVDLHVPVRGCRRVGATVSS